MDPKYLRDIKKNYYSERNQHSWIESEYSHMKFSEKEWGEIYRAFRGLTNKNVHMVDDNLTCEYSGLPSPKFYDNN